MTMLIDNPRLEEELKAQRKAWGADHHDEVWEGVYFMAPLPNDEHQELVQYFTVALHAVVTTAGLGEVRPGVNLAGTDEGWEHDYRAPDVVVFLASGSAENCDTHWAAPPTSSSRSPAPATAATKSSPSIPALAFAKS